MTWDFTELVLVEIDHVATQFRVISQCAPGQWMMSFTYAKEPSEAQDSVGHLAGAPPDHEIFDCAKSLALSIVHRRTLDLVGGDQLVSCVTRCACFWLRPGSLSHQQGLPAYSAPANILPDTFEGWDYGFGSGETAPVTATSGGAFRFGL